jgi:DNA-binding transcriptional LysR family regulator
VVLPPLQKYLTTWPDVQVEVSFTDRPADIVEDGFDLAVRVGEASPDTRLVSRVVVKYKAVLCASPHYFTLRGEPLSIDELSTHDGLIFSSRNRRQIRRFLDGNGAWVKAQGASRLRVDSGEALRDDAIAGLRIAFRPDFLVAGDLAAGPLRQVLPDLQSEDVKVVTIYPTRRLLEPGVRRFIDLMLDELGA